MWIGDLGREGNRLEFSATWADGHAKVFVEVPDDVETSRSGDALSSAALLPAMAFGDGELEVDRPVDAQLLGNAETIQDVMLSWDLSLRPEHARYRRVAIRSGQPQSARPEPDRGTACFFTGGVDSFYSVVKNRAEIDALVYVHGFDIPLDNTVLYDDVVGRLREAAEMLDLPLIELRTNLRVLEETSGAGWTDYHGAALSTIAHLLGPRFSRVIIPSSWGYAHMKPWGSHPLLDPLWSSNEVQIVHDGAETNRLGKVRALADSKAAHQHLRVCYKNPGNSYNCGVCDKCTRTGLAAVIAGVGDRFTTLPSPDASGIFRMRITDGSEVTWQDYHDDLTRTGDRPDIRRAIAFALARQRVGDSDPGRFVHRQTSRVAWAARHPGDVARRLRSRIG